VSASRTQGDSRWQQPPRGQQKKVDQRNKKGGLILFNPPLSNSNFTENF